MAICSICRKQIPVAPLGEYAGTLDRKGRIVIPAVQRPFFDGGTAYLRVLPGRLLITARPECGSHEVQLRQMGRVTIPATMRQRLGWPAGCEIVLSACRKGLTVRKWKSK